MQNEQVSKSEELKDDEQLEETHDDSLTTEETDGKVSVEIGQELDDVDPDNVPEQLRPAYQKLVDIRNNMNKQFTQKNQQISEFGKEQASLRVKADAFDTIVSHPVLGGLIDDVVNGREIGGSSRRPEGEPEKTPDPSTDPMGYMLSEIKGYVDKRVGLLDGTINKMGNFVAGNQAQLELDNLVAKYPVAKTIDVNLLRLKQSSYRKQDGSPISMEDAFFMMARDNPSLLNSPGEPPTKLKTTKKLPRVEKSTISLDVAGLKNTGNTRGLIGRVSELYKSGGLSYSAAIQRADAALRDKLSKVE